MGDTGWKQAADHFDPESVGWDNGGPKIALSNGNKTAQALPEYIKHSGWKHVRGNKVLAPSSSSNQQDNLYEFTIELESLHHQEVVMGVVDPDKAPKTPSCLHSCEAGDGVWIHFFSFSEIAEGDFLTALIDLNAKSLTFARNGSKISSISAMSFDAASSVVPVIELYGHDHPQVSLIALPFLDS